jgi:hypothetical protein
MNICPGLFDGTYNINDVYVKEREVKAMDKLDKSKNKLKTLPDNLVRHQFMGLLVKIAMDKYVRSKLILILAKKFNLEEAVVFSMENHFLPAMNTYDLHVWRKERYYNEKVDNFLKAHIPIFDAIYKNWAHKEPGVKE